MTHYTRRDAIKGIGAIGAGALGGLSGCLSSNSETYALSKGESSRELGIEIENINYENETADIYLHAGSTNTYEQGEQIVCDKSEETSESVHLKDIDSEMEEVKLRLEKGC